MSTRQKPKIAICLEYSALGFGGVEVLVAELTRKLSADYEIVLVSRDETAAISGSTLASSVADHFSLCPYTPGHTCGKPLAEFLKRTNTGIAHFHFGSGYSWGVRHWNQCPVLDVHRAGIPVVSTVHTATSIFASYCGPEKPFWFKLALFPLAWVLKIRELSWVEVEITVSRADLAKISRWYWPVKGRFRYLYHSRIESTAAPASGSPRRNVILAVGHIAARKGQQVLAAAFAKIASRFPEWQLWFAGSVAEKDCAAGISRIIADADLSSQIQLLGARTDALELMRNSSIYVQPSFFEGLPLALQEAMFSGCACVASRINGNDELITHGDNGLFFPAGDIDALAGELEKLILDGELRKSLGARAALSIVEKGMTAEAMVRQHRELYASLLT